MKNSMNENAIKATALTNEKMGYFDRFATSVSNNEDIVKAGVAT
jgi:hypothetical protein